VRQSSGRFASRISCFAVLVTTVTLLTASAPEAAPRLAFETSQGRFVVELDSQGVPRATENFLGLVERGDYDGTLIHRVIKDFLIQGGDPSGDGYGGQSIWGGPFAREIDPDAAFGKAGVLAMAHRADDQRNASQFFITLAPAPWLDGRYTIVGAVTEGMDVVQAIGATAVEGPSQRPIVDVLITRVRRIDTP
jgi:cyclophilin family peptidyl-prolyl cis-trans isomerase